MAQFGCFFSPKVAFEKSAHCSSHSGTLPNVTVSTRDRLPRCGEMGLLHLPICLRKLPLHASKEPRGTSLYIDFRRQRTYLRTPCGTDRDEPEPYPYLSDNIPVQFPSNLIPLLHIVFNLRMRFCRSFPITSAPIASVASVYPTGHPPLLFICPFRRVRVPRYATLCHTLNHAPCVEFPQSTYL